MNKPIIYTHLTDVVWLDLDDTLIDFKANSKVALRLTYNHFALNRFFYTPDNWIDAYETHNSHLWRLYAMGKITREFLRMDRFFHPLTIAGMSDAEATELSLKMDSAYLDYLAKQTRLIPGAIDLLQRLKNVGLTIGILSNGFADVQFRKIHNCGLEPFIDITVLSDDIGVNKPDVRLYRHAMTKVGVNDPSRHMMIGDNAYTDIAGALAAGWQAIHFISTESTPLRDIEII